MRVPASLVCCCLLMIATTSALAEVYTEKHHIVWHTDSDVPPLPFFDDRSGTRQLVDVVVGSTAEIVVEFSIHNDSAVVEGFAYAINAAPGATRLSLNYFPYFPEIIVFPTFHEFGDIVTGNIIAAPGTDASKTEVLNSLAGYQEYQLSTDLLFTPLDSVLAGLTGQGSFLPSLTTFWYTGTDTNGLLPDNTFGPGGVFPQSWDLQVTGWASVDLTYYYVPEPATMWCLACVFVVVYRRRFI